MARRIGGQYFAGAGEKRQTARRARMKVAETVQRQALAGPGGYMGGQALSQANRVGRRLLGSPGAGGYNLVPGGGGAGGGGGGGGGYLDDLDAANAANRKRHEEIKGGLSRRYQRGVGAMASLGTQQEADINQRYDSQASQVQQGMVNRGLTVSTIGPTMQLGVKRARGDELSRAKESRTLAGIDVDARLSGDYWSAVERHTQQAPDLAPYLSVAQQYGASGGGSPAVYGGYQVPGAGYFNVGGGSGQPQPGGGGGTRPLPDREFIAEGPQPGGGGGPGANPDIVPQPGGWGVGGGAGQPGGGGAVANVWDPREKQRLADFQRKFGHLTVEQLKNNPEAQRLIEEQMRKYGGGTPGRGVITKLAGGPVTRGGYMA